MRLRLATALVALITTAAPAATASPAARLASAVSLDFTMLGSPLEGVELGQQQGQSTCTGTGSAMTCTQAIGTNASHGGSAPVRDNGTGRSGTMTVACNVMYSGTSTSFADRKSTRLNSSHMSESRMPSSA